MTDKEKLRLKRIYFGSRANESMSFEEFISIAIANNYQPWKELALLDKSKGLTADNIYFSYVTAATKHQLGLGDNGKILTDTEKNKIYKLRTVGKLLMDMRHDHEKLFNFISEHEGSFEMDVLDFMYGNLKQLDRNISMSLEYLEHLDIIDKIQESKEKNL